MFHPVHGRFQGAFLSNEAIQKRQMSGVASVAHAPPDLTLNHLPRLVALERSVFLRLADQRHPAGRDHAVLKEQLKRH